MKLHEVKTGDTFKIGSVECIKFREWSGRSIVVSRHSVCDVPFCSFERNGVDMESMSGYGDYRKSDIHFHLNKWILREIERHVGSRNICEFQVCGLKTKIAIPSKEFFKDNKWIFDKYKIARWWVYSEVPEACADYACYVDVDNKIQISDIPSEYFPCGIRFMVVLNSDIEVTLC